MAHATAFRIGFSMLLMLGISTQAQAWNPNAGADSATAYSTPSYNAPTTAPTRLYGNQALAPLPAPAAYMPAAAPTTYYSAPAQQYQAAPATQYYAPPVAAAATQPITNTVVTQTPAYSTYAPAANAAPVQAATTTTYTQPATTYYAPVANAAPAPAPSSQTVVVQPSPMSVQVNSQPVATQPYQAYAAADPVINSPMASRALLRNRYSLGIEGFYDSYREPDTFPDLHDKAYYGAINGSMEHDINARWFTGIDGRVSYGRDNYSSDSGKLDNVPQWEFESRLMTGYNGVLYDGSRLKPYIGLGARYFMDQSSGKITNIGQYGYDRDIFQLYVPIGLSYSFQASGYTITPNAELDPLLYGHVVSHLSDIAPGFEDVKNNQHSGMGWRAEIMFSKLHDNGKGWEFGPFVRYWGIDDSNNDHYQEPTGPHVGYEPKNTRWQTGAKLKYLF